jgi:hypothetical protein
MYPRARGLIVLQRVSIYTRTYRVIFLESYRTSTEGYT